MTHNHYDDVIYLVTKTILKMLLGAIQQEADDRGYEICTLLETSEQGMTHNNVHYDSSLFSSNGNSTG